ncbi:FAD-dependent oxidoreductase [Schleiferia thermophila]|jgi:kynurenine 3-monooxygenase|uniref:Kynurenine 3-monooxygenase n=1 Tax=Schleiferia thermophila TaxID=884107 RepID=A0A369A7A3_9FLAO|nr:NAD(P)/FAD-dependent oxidoreductase [Schleiferia thermophila]KFD39519.1 kynurenine 3-monooxygenase [Schleiferia thermophila str. Yellowstone]RCX05033.1 kynurenine 3-monooxygenase [Schleiferia thermophila]GCD79449.1 kynurenine 3-monooxygenase [Schleiferia thermophila]
MKQKKDITIVGGGLVGALLAIYFAKRGHKVKVFERRPDPRKTSVYAGRSINLALSDRGWKALRDAGLEQEIKRIALPMYHRGIHQPSGEYVRQPYGQPGQAIYSVSRGGLNIALLNAADAFDNVELFFNRKCVEVDFQTTEVKFLDSSSNEVVVKSDYIFGADGAFSGVRGEMMKTDRFNYQQEYISHGYKELNIPAGPDGQFLLENNALHIWPRKDYMLIALPNLDGTFTCTLFFPFEGEYSFATLTDAYTARKFFQENFSDALALIPDFENQWQQNPVSSLCIIRCYPWVRNQTALIGDAAHAIVPFYGQGMNSGFEDVEVLFQLLDSQSNWDKALDEYQKLRKPDADAIADLAMRNFIEMRDLTADPKFLLQKKIEARIQQKYPDLWTPLYSMVTFSHIRYSEALKLGKIHDQIMESIMNRPDIHSIWESEEIENEIITKLKAIKA